MKKTPSSAQRNSKVLVENSLELKNKIKDLETEVASLKQRLDVLRKAKSNLIVKREREVVQVSTPAQGRSPVESSRLVALEKRLVESETRRADAETRCRELQEAGDDMRGQLEARRAEAERARAIERAQLPSEVVGASVARSRPALGREQLQAKFDEAERHHVMELARAATEVARQTTRAEEAEMELAALRQQLVRKPVQAPVRSSNSKNNLHELRSENAGLQRKNDELLKEAKIKEANRVRDEDALRRKIEEECGAKYAKLLEDAERKLDGLRKANLELKSSLNRGKRPEHALPNSSNTQPAS